MTTSILPYTTGPMSYIGEIRLDQWIAHTESNPTSWLSPCISSVLLRCLSHSSRIVIVECRFAYELSVTLIAVAPMGLWHVFEGSVSRLKVIGLGLSFFFEVKQT